MPCQQHHRAVASSRLHLLQHVLPESDRLGALADGEGAKGTRCHAKKLNRGRGRRPADSHRVGKRPNPAAQAGVRGALDRMELLAEIGAGMLPRHSPRLAEIPPNLALPVFPTPPPFSVFVFSPIKNSFPSEALRSMHLRLSVVCLATDLTSLPTQPRSEW